MPLPAPSLTVTASTRRVPPDSVLPAAGACARIAGRIVTIAAMPDTPQPRCVVVTADQRLRVVNRAAGAVVAVRFAAFPTQELKLGQAVLYTPPMGRFLAPGVHDVHISLYAGSAEVWLR